MKKIYTFAAVAAAILAIVSCAKEQQEVKGKVITKTIELGFADETSDGSLDSKNYLANATTGEVRWASSGADQTVHAFTGDNVRYAFTSTSTTLEQKRAFTCNTWPADAWMKLITWHGKVSTNAVLNGWTLTGSNIEIKSTQAINNTNSFDNTQNIVVMKPGDTGLRSVFGFLRYKNPPFDYYSDNRRAGIKTVVITADEDIAGKVSIDYSGDDPVATIISNSSASKSITINARIKGSGPSGAEGGYVYVPMVPGTYHNVRLTITPYAEEPIATTTAGNDTIATGTPFTVHARGDVIIERARYTDGGTLPTEAPAGSYQWPNDPEAFDYGLAAGASHTASIHDDSLAKWNVIYNDKTKVTDEEPYNTPSGRLHNRLPSPYITVDRMIWMSGASNGGTLQWKRIAYNRVKTFDTIENSVKVANDIGVRFKINKPGTFRIFPMFDKAVTGEGGTTITKPWADYKHRFNAVLRTVKNGVASATTIYSEIPDADHISGDSNNQNNDQYAITFTVTEAMLYGMEEAATIYFWHAADNSNNSSNGLTVNYYPPKWTSAQ